MEWSRFNDYGLGLPAAFENLCCELFDLYGREEYSDINEKKFRRINGAGGDGGVEAVWTIRGVETVGVQAKWFPSSMQDSQWNQIRGSIDTAKKVRSNLTKYIVCIPHNLNSKTAGKKRSEEDRWAALVESCKDKYPELEVALWDEARLESLLFKEGFVGVYTHWFSGSAIPESCFSESYKLQLEGWLNGRYSSVLHQEGRIQAKVDDLLSSVSLRTDALEKLKSLEIDFRSISQRIDYLLEIKEQLPDEVLESAQNANDVIENALKNTGGLTESLMLEEDVSFFRPVTDALGAISTLERALETVKYRDNGYYSAYSLSKWLKRSRKGFTVGEIDELQARLNNRIAFFVGGPGVGKTHAVCASAAKCLNERTAFPILVQASTAPVEHGWRGVITHALRIGNRSESVLFGELNSMARRLDLANLDDSPVYKGKILILVDGLDESLNEKRWLELIRESKVLVERYDRVRFCFTSRPGFVDDLTRGALNSCMFYLWHSGDVDVGNLVESYLDYYDISVDPGCDVTRCVSTPLELNLLCTANQGRCLGEDDLVDVTFDRLIRDCLDRIETEVASKIGQTKTNQPVHLVLNHCSKEFLNERQVSYAALRGSERLVSQMHGDALEKTLEHLVKYGVLYSRRVKGAGIFDPDDFIYEPGYQSFFDNALASSFVNECDDMSDAKIPEFVAQDYEILRLVGVLALERTGYLLVNNESFKAAAESYGDVIMIGCEILSSCSFKAAAGVVGIVKEWMELGSTELVQVTNNLIIPVSNRTGHPLGPVLLDEYLRGFDKPALRDRVWSLPDYLQLKEKTRESIHEGFLVGSCLALNGTELWNGLPLVVAWHLSTLVERRRVECEQLLTKWGFACPEQFHLLFAHMQDVNDPQILESIYSVAAAISLGLPRNSNCLGELAEIAFCNVFTNNTCIDASLRHYGRILVERAADCSQFDKESLDECTPPFSSSDDSLPLDRMGLDGHSNCGPAPMTYDLSRYVICDPLEGGFFQKYQRTSDDAGEIDDFLKKQANRIGENILTPAQFCHCAVQGYLELMGWTNQGYHFYEKEEGGSRESYGIDISISREGYPGDHGSRSETATIGEKYVWTARNSILGYLADRLRFRECCCDSHMVDDYSELESYRTLFGPDGTTLSALTDETWSRPDSVLLDRASVGTSSQQIIDWVKDDDLLEDLKDCFAGSLFVDVDKRIDQPFALSLYLHSEAWGVRKIIWANACMVERSDFESLLAKVCNENTQVRNEFLNPDRLMASVRCNCYVSPQEICASTWKKEEDSSIGSVDGEDSDGGCVPIFPCSLECISNTLANGDAFFKIPSQTVRKMLNVQSCIDVNGFDETDKKVFEFRSSGELGDDLIRQSLFVDAAVFNKELLNADMRLVWGVRSLRETDLQFAERNSKKFAERDRVLLVYEEGDTLKSKTLLDKFDQGTLVDTF